MTVLAVDVGGTPRRWIGFDEAIAYHATGSVAWSLGEVIARYHGGVQQDGTVSYLESTSIIAIRGHGFNPQRSGTVGLSNRTLFGRDRHTCAYCGRQHLNHHNLSRDHIVPRSRGGENTWMNVVTACRSCNGYKSNMTLKESGMELLYLPYVPSHHESMILQNRNILGCQMEYLAAGLPKHSRVRLN